jgi:uncharacterized protein YaaW (UPF0174 family)
MAKKSFKLKSGNATPFKKMGSSPLKQAIGGGPGEAVYHWKKYKAAKAQDKAVEKLMTDKNISRKAFDTKLAKITKTVDPHPKLVKQTVKKGVIKTVGKVASRLAGPIGAGLLAYDVLKTGVKRIVKGIKTGKPQTKLKGKNIKDTFKRVPKKKYI